MRTGFVRIKSIASMLAATVFMSVLAQGQQYEISTFAGGGPPPSPAPALSVSLGTIWGAATDAAGNVYLSSSDLHSVFRLDSAGQLTLYAGNGRAGYSGDGALAVAAQIDSPRGLAVDTAGNLFISDMNNGRIRKVSPSGMITTIPGATQLQNPFAVAVDSSGNAFVSEFYAHRIRRISASGDVVTVAGSGVPGFSGDGGSAVDARLNAPAGVAVDHAGNLYIADYGNALVRKVSVDGTITTIAGGGASRSDGAFATDAQLLGALGVALDQQGGLYIAEEYAGIRKVAPDGTIATVAGGGQNWNFPDGAAATSVVLLPIAVAVDAAGNLSIADWTFNTRVRRVSPDGQANTIAGDGEYCCFSGDNGPAAGAQLADPASVAIDPAGNVYIADAHNGRIRKVSPQGVIATVATACQFPDDLWSPCAIAVDARANLYTADESGVFRISPDGAKVKLAESGTGLALDRDGNLFIADPYNRVIRKVSPDGTSSIVAGRGTIGFSGDGGPATQAELSLPISLAVDASGNLYIADSGNGRIRVVSPSGLIHTAVDASADFDANFTAYGLNNLITGLAVDESGNILFEELSASFRRIQKASPDGAVITIAGTAAAGYSGDGGSALRAQLNPTMDELGNTLAVDGSGNVYVIDGANNAVRVLRPLKSRKRFRPEQ